MDDVLKCKKKNNSVANALFHSRSQTITENREHVKFLLKTLFLGKQGLAFRGKNEEQNSSNKGNFKRIN